MYKAYQIVDGCMKSHMMSFNLPD